MYGARLIKLQVRDADRRDLLQARLRQIELADKARTKPVQRWGALVKKARA